MHNNLTIKTSNKRSVLILIPLIGILLFVLLYIISTMLYPGGSQANKNATGFSWVNNYWCNLLNEKAMNGQVNKARPVALIAMVVLSVTLAVFWFLFSQIIDFTKMQKNAIAMSGVAAMVSSLFLFTAYHDIVINIAGVLGLVALTGTFAGLYKNKWYNLFILGLLNIVLIIVNNILYYSIGLLKYLPIVQKITFLFFLLWICLIDIQLLNKAKKNN